MADPTPTVTVEEACRLLGLSRACVEKALKRGDIPNDGKLGGRWALSRRAIEVYVETGKWPQPNPAAEEVAGLVVERLSEILQAGMEAGMEAALSAMAEVAAGEDRGMVVKLARLRKVG